MIEITDEQRAAWLWLQTNTPGNSEVIAPLLPSDLTNPQPVLPTEPGYYLDRSGDVWERQTDHWYLASNFVGDDRARDFAPFTRLVPERPQIQPDQVVEALRGAGEQGGPWAVRRILDLANGTVHE